MRLFRLNTEPQLSFEEVLKKYERPLYLHIRRMVVSHDDTADILQETFIKIYQGLPKLREPEALKAWVYRIATNEAIRFLNKQKEEPLSAIEESEWLTGKLMDEEYVDYDDKMAITFQKAVLTLTEQQRLVFNLRYYDELSYEEISEITGATVNTLKVAYHNAKEKIKNYMLNE